MVNWKMINKIALVFGIIFIVFTALAAVINYELDKLEYTSAAPASFIDYSFISAMLPYLVLAVLSLTVYVISASMIKPEAQEKETQQTETHPEPEDVFTEST
jgi:large-conductance mechanosensitive channel